MTQSATKAKPFADQLERLRGARDAFHELRPAVIDGEPWPLAEQFDTEPEARWGPSEVLAHVAEMLPFWLGEVERILAASTGPAPFGRLITNELRIATIERDRTLPARELFDRIESGIGRLDRRLSELSPAEAGRTGVHATQGQMTLPEVTERFVVNHLEEHAAQLRDALS
jgi:DinB superfamily